MSDYTSVCSLLLAVLHICSGLSVNLSGSASHAVLDKTFQFTCTVTDDTSTMGLMTFSVSGSTQDCAVIVSSCTQFTPVEGFTCGCVSGQSGEYYLNITSVSLMDDGRWECRRLQSSDSKTLPVYYGPFNNMTLDKSSPQIVTEAVTPSLTVDCSATCKPCSYTWTKGALTVASSRTLSLTSITRNQTGDYICTAVNTATGVTSSALTLTVTVYYAPDVNLEARCRPYRVYVGQQNVQLTCQVTAANPTVTSYSWTRDGSSIPSATSSMYSLSPVTRGSAGNYTCAARNSVGTSSSPGIGVDVQYPPNVSVPSSQTLIETQTLTVTCSVDSKPAAAVRWTQKDDSSFTPQTGSTLTISNIQRSQAGTYVCTATNTLSPCWGTALPRSESREMTVDVQYGPSMSGVPSTSPVTETTALHINCNSYTVHGNPTFTNYRWTGPGYSSSGPVLNITSIIRTASGVYNCTASNTLTPAGGQPQTGSAIGQFHVDVQYPPIINTFTINSRSNKVTVEETASVNLGCRVDSNPASTIKLMNGSSELKTIDKALVVYHNWTADCRDRGNYTCTADNKLMTGEMVTRKVELIVRCSPRLDESVSKELKYASKLGGNLNVTVSVLAYPPPIFTWSRTTSTSQDLTGSSIPVSAISVTARLHLTNLQQQDFGDYSLTVDNGIDGSVSYTINIVYEDSPETPTRFRTSGNATASSLWLSWQPEFNGGHPQTFVVEYRQYCSTTWSVYNIYDDTDKMMVVEVSGLTPGTTYIFRLHARNEYLPSHRAYVYVETKTDGVPTDTKDLEAVNSGILAGTAIGTLLLTLLIEGIVLMLLYRKGFRIGNSHRETASRESSRSHEIAEMDNIGYSSLDHVNGPQQDSSLKKEESDKSHYSQLKIYENTKAGDEGETSTYEGMTETPPVTYEAIRASPYQNSSAQ
ncbi:neural cell adhesion molecule 1-like [Haliotis cracherodii]|uniref:neural cell adhesion molecule 1-like n=1 Tax=Haliotis cracherodii TaxID=6455 RepID=UPI0039E805E5